jgi:hypothetical protein
VACALTGGGGLEGGARPSASFELPKHGFAVPPRYTLGGPPQKGYYQGFSTLGWGQGPRTRDNIRMQQRSIFEAVLQNCKGANAR